MVRNIAILLAAATLTTAPAFAQKGGSAETYRVGVVDTEIIVKQLPEAKAAEEQLGKLIQQYRGTIDSLGKELRERLQKYEQTAGMMTAEAKQTEEQSLQAMQQQAMQFQEEKFGNTGEIARRRDDLLVPIRKKVQEAIKNVAKDEKLSMVLEKAGGLVLFAEDKLDITFRVLDKIKRAD